MAAHNAHMDQRQSQKGALKRNASREGSGMRVAGEMAMRTSTNNIQNMKGQENLKNFARHEENKASVLPPKSL